MPVFIRIRQCEQKNYSKKFAGGEKEKEPKNLFDAYKDFPHSLEMLALFQSFYMKVHLKCVNS